MQPPFSHSMAEPQPNGEASPRSDSVADQQRPPPLWSGVCLVVSKDEAVGTKVKPQPGSLPSGATVLSTYFSGNENTTSLPPYFLLYLLPPPAAMATYWRPSLPM